jgi:hypothetical protein
MEYSCLRPSTVLAAEEQTGHKPLSPYVSNAAPSFDSCDIPVGLKLSVRTHGPIDEHAPPDLEADQRPDALRVISRALDVLFDRPAHNLAVKQSSSDGAAIFEQACN